MRISIVVVFGLALGCGGPPKPPATAAAKSSASAASPPPVVTPSGPVTEAECRALIGHVIALAVRETPSTAPPDAAAHDQVSASLNAELLAPCLENVSRSQIECALSATSQAALRACDDS